MITKNSNLSKTDLNTMLLSKFYDSEIVEFLSEFNFTIITSQKLVVLLTDNPEQIIESTADEYLNRNHSFHGKPLSDHLPIKTIIQTNMTLKKQGKNMPT